MSAIMLMGSSRPKIALSFVNPQLASWALALNFAGRCSGGGAPGGSAGLNRRRKFADYGIRRLARAAD
jgi:hypothetical protein